MTLFEKIKAIDTDPLSTVHKEIVIDWLDEYGKASDKQLYLDEFGTETGNQLLKDIEAAQKQMEQAKKKAEAKAKVPPRKKGKVPTENASFVLFETYADEIGLNLPLHETISATEFNGLANKIAEKACKARNCYEDQEGKKSVPDLLVSHANKWLKHQNDLYKKLVKNAKLASRKKPENLTVAQQTQLKAIQDKALALKAKRGATPRKKKQFGTRLVEGIAEDVKRSAKRQVQQGNTEIAKKRFSTVKKDAQAFLKSLQVFAGQKDTTSLAKRLTSLLDEIAETVLK